MSDLGMMNEAMYERLGEIAKFASNKRVELDPDIKGDKSDETQNRLMLAAFRELRQMCEFYKPSEKEPIVPGFYYTPGWLCELAKKLDPQNANLRQSDESTRMSVREDSPNSRSEAKKPTMDFGRFHVTRAAIPGTTILTFCRKREHQENFATVVPGRIIVAKITRKDVGPEKPDHRFTVKSYMAGEKPRVLFAGDSWVGMSKTEKIVYKMVKCNIKETQRRRIRRKRAAAAKAAAATHS